MTMRIAIAGLGISVAALAVAASAAPAHKLPDWSGVWGQGLSRNMDPDTKTGSRQNPPLNAEYRARYEDYLTAVAAGKPHGDIGCLPEGMPRIMRAPFPMEVVVSPEQVWVLSEFKRETRRIYTDGRKVPADVDPSYEGYSTGRWEGDTLVVDTVAIKRGTIDSGGLEHSDKLTTHERMRRVDHNTFEDRITMTDPEVFTRPWTVVRHYPLQPTWEIKEYVCEENERNPINKPGQTGVTLKQ